MRDGLLKAIEICRNRKAPVVTCERTVGYNEACESIIIDLTKESNRLEKLSYASPASSGVQNGGRKSKEYEALTVQALHQLNEIYDGNDRAFMDRDQFIDTYLDGIGEYEKKIAKKHGIEIR